MSALQRDVGVYNPANNSAMLELDDENQHNADNSANLKKIEVMQSGPMEGKICIREWRGLKRISQGSVGNGVMRSYVRPHPFFIDNSTHIHLPARAADLKSLAQPTTMTTTIIYSVLCYSRQNAPRKSLNSTWRQSKFKKRVQNRPSRRIQCRQGGTRNSRRAMSEAGPELLKSPDVTTPLKRLS